MRKIILMLMVTFLLSISNLAFASGEAGGEHEYVGVKKCAMCHKAKSKGDQYSKWLSSKHAQAYKVLATPEAEEAAQKAGVSGDPQQAPECLKCHVTAYGVDESLLGSGIKKEDGVQCETCHGAGGDYKSLSVMRDEEKAIEAGLITPTEEVCLKCHNAESPNFTGFDFEKYYKDIAHPRPKN